MGRLLVAYSNASNYVSTTAQYLAAFGRFSRWDVRYLHVTNGAEIECDLGDFDAVLQSYCARLPIEGCVVPQWTDMLREFRGLKILAVQDEYDHTNRLRAAINDIGFDVVLTCVPVDQIDAVYPPTMFPGVTFFPVLTGYVPEGLAERTSLSIKSRPIEIGYRGRDIGPRYGQLAFDKLNIGMQMKRVCEDRGIAHDIAWGEGDRFYGDDWYRWLGQCRATLATESGSNVFDWDGEVEAEVRRRNPKVEWASFLEWVRPYEAGHDMGQISPRIFEAAAMGAALVLYPGKYSGILEPDRHYIPLERDLSNIDEVLRRVRNVRELTAMAKRTRRDLIWSGRFSYRRFIQIVDDILDASVTDGRGALPAADAPVTMDCAAARTMVERPTGEPQAPLLNAFKQMARHNEQLRLGMLYSQELLAAFSARLNDEKESYQSEIFQLRRKMVTKNVRCSDVGALPH